MRAHPGRHERRPRPAARPLALVGLARAGRARLGGGTRELWVAGTTLTNVFYVARKVVGADRARLAVAACLDGFRVAAVSDAVLRDALALAGRDFEDDVQIAAARAEGLDGVVTRDPKGFATSTVAVWDPVALAALLGS